MSVRCYSLPLLLGFLSLVFATTVPVLLKEPYSRALNLSHDYRLVWTISGDTIAFNITIYNVYTWAGLGFHEAGSNQSCMPYADFMIGTFEKGPLVVNDYFTDYYSPSEDTTQTPPGIDNILEFSGRQQSKNTYINFSRKLMTKDHLYDHNITDATMNVIFAHGYSQGLYQGHESGDATMGNIDLNFFAPKMSPATNSRRKSSGGV